MTRTKLATPLAKTSSSFQKKLNNIAKQYSKTMRGIERKKKQIALDYEFKNILRNKYPKIYWEIVDELKREGKVK